MDPKALNNLDPKLRETYDRVMGTPTTAAPPPPPDNPQPQADLGSVFSQPTPPPQVDNTLSSNLSSPPPPADPPADQQVNAVPAATTYVPPPVQPLPSPASVGQAHQSFPVLRIVYIVGGIIFFVVYTYFWIKVFNLPVPF